MFSQITEVVYHSSTAKLGTKVEAIATAIHLVKYRLYFITHVSCHQAKLDSNFTFPFRPLPLHLIL